MASCLFLALSFRYSEGPPGVQGVATSPPAMASSKVSRIRPLLGRGLLEGDRAAVPAGREDSQQPPQDSRPPHTAVLEGLSLSRASPAPRSLLPLPFARLPSSVQPSQTPGDSPGPCAATSDEAAAGRAPTFQLGQHLELGCELAMEAVLDAVHLLLVVLHGRAEPRDLSDPTTLSELPAPSLCASPAPSFPAPPINGRYAWRRSPLVSGRGGSGAALTSRAGLSQCSGARVADSGSCSLAPTVARPMTWAGRGRGCARRPGPARRGPWPERRLRGRRSRWRRDAGARSRASHRYRGPGRRGLTAGGFRSGRGRRRGSQPGSAQNSSACAHHMPDVGASSEGKQRKGYFPEESGRRWTPLYP